MNKTCCIFNLAPSYRLAIYQLMDRELSCDFYIGDQVGVAIKTMDYTSLKGFKRTLKYIPIIGGFYWQMGAIRTLGKPYKNYIITGEVRCLSTWVILGLGKIMGKKINLWSHGFYGKESLLYRQIKKVFFRLAHHTFLYGDYAKKLMVANGISCQRLSPIYNSLDYHTLQKIASETTASTVFYEHFGNNDPVLIYLGRLQKVKRLDLLFLAVYLLGKQGVACNIAIIGADVDGVELQNLTAKYQLDQRVWLHEAIFDDVKIGNFFHNAAICVSPGNVGLLAVHSLTFGCPVITHGDFSQQMPEFEAIQAGITGDFFAKGDAQNLAVTIQNFLQNHAKTTTADNCRKIIAEKYNPNYQLQVLRRVLEK